MGYTGSYNAQYGRDSENVSERGFIETYGFEVILKVHGEHEGVGLTTIVPVESDPDEERPLGQIRGVSEGDLVLMFLHKPRADSLLKTRSPALWFRTSMLDHYFAPFRSSGQNVIRIPEIAYTAEGVTPVEKFVSILSQAFAETRELDYLTKIRSVGPRWSREDGVPVVREHFTGGGLYDGPTFLSFFAKTVKPRLVQAVVNDPILTLHAYEACMQYADRTVQPLHKALLLQVDNTWTDIEAYVPIGPRNVEWVLSLLNARLPSIRAQAVGSLPKNMEYTALVKLKLDDESPSVRTAAVGWFEQTYSRDLEADPDAVRLPRIRDGRRNFEDDLLASVDYWKRKLRSLG